MKFFWQKDNNQNSVVSSPVVIGEAQGEGELDQYSATWMFIKNYAEKRIARLRERNDSVTADTIKTAVLRGEIRALKDLLSLPEGKRRGLLFTEDQGPE